MKSLQKSKILIFWWVSSIRVLVGPTTDYVICFVGIDNVNPYLFNVSCEQFFSSFTPKVLFSVGIENKGEEEYSRMRNHRLLPWTSRERIKIHCLG